MTGTRVVSEARRFKGLRIPTDGNKCRFGKYREPKQIVGELLGRYGRLAAVSRALDRAKNDIRVLRLGLDPDKAEALAAEIERMMKEGEGET